MSPCETKPEIATELARLRLELIELAFTLDQRGQCEAADVATMVAAELSELLPLKTEAPL
ncbi:hypothetical protein [Actomonas aquatica]|uniref:Uncharacterized protein n=1 Tax=Actomonas aquatica TaxID=2866162 RepID=A0ABZ1C804_9BACT|nr:hypothetical protein [Opitutus sp. WL0086]WRQ87457.1 hypothetical protein K1X11_021800 [Opitutus sp. WL0086]